jgi:hypothetical protein
VEEPETGNAQQDIAKECTTHLKQVKRQTFQVVKDPIGQKSTKHNDGAVY